MSIDDAPASDEIMAVAYQTASRFRDEAPWDRLTGNHPFQISFEGFDDPDIVCTVLGSGREVYGIALYPGDEGRRCYEPVRLNRVPRRGHGSELRAVTLTFQDREALLPEARKQIKRLGLTYRGAGRWPQFLSHCPDYEPWLLTEQEAQWITAAMKWALQLAAMVTPGAQLNWTSQSERIATFVAESDDRVLLTMRPLPPVPPPLGAIVVPPDIPTIEKLLLAAKRHSGTWEFGVFPSGALVTEPDGRPYVPRLALAVDAESELPLCVSLLAPWQWPTDVPDALLSAIATCETVPAELHTDDATVAAIVAPTAEALGIELARAKVPVARNVASSYRRFVGYRRR